MAFNFGRFLRNNVTSSSGFAKHAMSAGNVLGVTMATGAEMAFGGKSFGSALATGVGKTAIGTMIPGYMHTGLISGGAEMMTKSYLDYKRYGHQKWEKAHNSNFGGSYQDSEAAYTMRQRSLSAMSQSRSNARSVLGSEARSLHR